MKRLGASQQNDILACGILVAMIFALAICSCSPIAYNTNLSALRDPMFDFSKVRVIGFTPVAYKPLAKAQGIT